MDSKSSKSVAVRLAMTISIAAFGGTIFYALNLPAAWLSGGMVFVALATLSGVPTVFPNKLRDALFALIGISMGAGVQPDVVNRVGEWPISMALLVVVVVGVTLVGFLVLHYGAKWSRETAYFGAIPGALSYVLALASERGADIPRIASSQSVRLFVLVAILPFAVVSSNGEIVDLEVTMDSSTPFEIALGVPLCLVASWIAVKLRVPGGWMTGAFFMSAGLNASGWVPLVLPQYVITPSFVMVGAMIGCRFTNMTFSNFISMLGASLAAFAAGFITAVLGAWLAASLIDIPFGQALLAYAPGGLEVMTLLAFMLDLDPAFVATHQIARFTSMVLLLPFVTTFVLGKRETPSSKH